eukprot:1244677-Amphidinium_carterae.1
MADVPPPSGPCHMAGIGRRALQRSLFSRLRHSEKPTPTHREAHRHTYSNGIVHCLGTMQLRQKFSESNFPTLRK